MEGIFVVEIVFGKRMSSATSEDSCCNKEASIPRPTLDKASHVALFNIHLQRIPLFPLAVDVITAALSGNL
jgi:hypothetical protein